MLMPMPTVTVLSRAVGDSDNSPSSFLSQDITLMPTSSSTLEEAAEACVQASAAVKRGIEERMKVGGTSIFELRMGLLGARARTSSIEQAVSVKIITVPLFGIPYNRITVLSRSSSWTRLRMQISLEI